VAALFCVATLVACGPLVPADQPIRDDDGIITEPNPSTDPFAIVVGDCLDDALIAADTGSEVETLPTVPCDQPHDSEVIASLELTGTAYPGVEAIAAEADAGCIAALEQRVGASYLDTRYDVSYYAPTELSWADGDREVLCVAYDPAGPLTGPLTGPLPTPSG
jgi:hypothetical protein